jgi:hypothetical protein
MLSRIRSALRNDLASRIAYLPPIFSALSFVCASRRYAQLLLCLFVTWAVHNGLVELRLTQSLQ